MQGESEGVVRGEGIGGLPPNLRLLMILSE